MSLAKLRLSGTLVLITALTAAGAGPVGSKEPRGSTEDRERGRESVGRARTYWKALDLIGFRGVGLVAKDGQTLLLQGSGGVAPTATFNIASIAKSLTAVAVLRLARRGKLQFDDPIVRFFPDAPEDKRAITVQQLLTHTSGLGNPAGDTAAGIKERSAAVRKILATPLADPPGHGYAYSNDGYTVLAAILEVAASKSWEQVMREEVLRPAGMRHSFFAGDAWPSGPYAVAQAAVMDGGNQKNAADWGSKGGAGIYSNAQDLLRFLTAALDGTLLGPEGARELGKSFALDGQAIQYSRVFRLGNVPGRGPEWSHGGASTESGHYSILCYYPDTRLVLIVFGLDDEGFRTEVSSGLGKILFGEEKNEVPPPQPGRPASFRQTLALSGEGLHFQIEQGSRSATLLPQNPEATTFLVARSPAERETLEACVAETRKLLDQVARLAESDGEMPDSPVGRAAAAWRQANRENGAAKETTILGATPNWVDGLGGTLSFVRVLRSNQSMVFRLYWTGATLRARGGQAYKNPAPMRLIDFGGGRYGGWNPAIGVYVDLRLSTAKDGARAAILTAGGKSVRLAAAAARP